MSYQIEPRGSKSLVKKGVAALVLVAAGILALKLLLGLLTGLVTVIAWVLVVVAVVYALVWAVRVL